MLESPYCQIITVAIQALSSGVTPGYTNHMNPLALILVALPVCAPPNVARSIQIPTGIVPDRYAVSCPVFGTCRVPGSANTPAMVVCLTPEQNDDAVARWREDQP